MCNDNNDMTVSDLHTRNITNRVGYIWLGVPCPFSMSRSEPDLTYQRMVLGLVMMIVVGVSTSTDSRAGTGKIIPIRLLMVKVS